MADIIYSGIALPTEQYAYPYIKEEKELIRDSVITILMTKIGQRLFVPDFGSNLWSLVFEQDDSVTQQLADKYIREALRTWEPRINVLKVDYFPEYESNSLKIRIAYIILRLNEAQIMTLDISRDNFSLISATSV